MRKILIASSIFFSLFVYGLFISQSQFMVIREELEPKNPVGLYDYRGVINVHSRLGQGSGTTAEIVHAAQETGVDFIFMNDVNPLTEERVTEGYYRKTLLLAGSQYNYLDSRIMLFDSIKKHNFDSLGQAQLMLTDFLSQDRQAGADELVILAHPFKSGYRWSGPIPPGMDGVEVLNLKSIWQKAWINSKLSFIWSILIYPFNSQLALLRLYTDSAEELALWDSLLSTRPTVGIAGSEATAKTAGVGGEYLRFPSYQTSFSLMSNHVLLRSELTGEFDRDRHKIFSALNNGQFYMSLDILGSPKGFSAVIQDDERTYLFGETIRWNPRQRMLIHLPQMPHDPFEVAIFKDGQHVMSSNSQDTEFNVYGPGVYRIVVRVIPTLPLPDGKKWIPWIFTNPFYVHDREVTTTPSRENAPKPRAHRKKKH